MSKKLFIVLGLLIAVSMVLAACATETAEPETVVETVIVEGEGETVVETVIVEQEGETVVETVIVEVEAEPTPVPPTDRVGGWLDEVTMSIVSADSAVTQIEAGASDLYASNLSTPQDLAAIEEAQRCLLCRNRNCVSGCPVGVSIPEFIDNLANGNLAEAAGILQQDNALPAVCAAWVIGCPAETRGVRLWTGSGRTDAIRRILLYGSLPGLALEWTGLVATAADAPGWPPRPVRASIPTHDEAMACVWVGFHVRAAPGPLAATAKRRWSATNSFAHL